MRVFLKSSGIGLLLLLIGCSNTSRTIGTGCEEKYDKQRLTLVGRSYLSVRTTYGTVQLNDGSAAQCILTPYTYKSKYTPYNVVNSFLTKCGEHEFPINLISRPEREKKFFYMNIVSIFDKNRNEFPLKLVNYEKNISCKDINSSLVKEAWSEKKRYKVVANPEKSSEAKREYVKDKLYTFKIYKERFFRLPKGPEF